MAKRNIVFFNMIEVVLALLVIALGFTAILGLIPIGMKNYHRSFAENHSADASDELLNFISSRLQKDWSGVSAAIPSNDPNGMVAIDAIESWTQVSGTNIYTHPVTPGVYRLFIRTLVNDKRQFTDFDGILRIWKTPSVGWEHNSATALFVRRQDTNYDRRIILNMEVSWPTSTAYKYRTKQFYSIEVVRHD